MAKDNEEGHCYGCGVTVVSDCKCLEDGTFDFDPPDWYADE